MTFSDAHADDVALARAVARGDRDAWDRFVTRYSNIIFSIARRFSKDYDTAMDIYTYVLESLRAQGFKKLKTYTGKSKLSTWLVVVSRNLGIDHYRTKHGRNRAYKAIARLAPEDQLLFRLYYQDGFSLGETCEIMRTNYQLDITLDRLSQSLKRIELLLTRHKLWKLQSDLQRQPLIYEDSRPVEETANPNLDDPAQIFARSQSLTTLNNLTLIVEPIIEKLPNQDKLLIKLLFFQQLTAKEVARTIGLADEQAVYSRCRRLLKQLRTELLATGFTEEAFRALAKNLPA